MSGAVDPADDCYDRAAVARLMRPRAIAIVGISSKPGSAGHSVLGNLTVNDYRGDIHLVGRSGGTIDGRPVLATVDDLPETVDLAVFTLPAAGVRDTVEACVRRKVGAAVIFASGFAETGARDAQSEIATIARDGGLALLGPNCLGYANYIDGLVIGFTGGTAGWARICARPSNRAICRSPTRSRAATRRGSGWPISSSISPTIR
jgi:acyl-CoA synthetase (NDP forming)